MRRRTAEPQLRQGAEVRLVVHGQGQFRGEQGAEVGVVPVEVGGAYDGVRVARDQTGDGDREACRTQPFQFGLTGHVLDEGGEVGEHRPGCAAPVADAPHGTRAYLTAQVDRAHRKVVDTDLRPDAGRSPSADRERGSGAAHPARTLGAQLVQKSRTDQLVHQRGHGGAGQADPGRHSGARQRALCGDRVHHPGEVAATHALLGVGEALTGAASGPFLSCGECPLPRRTGLCPASAVLHPLRTVTPHDPHPARVPHRRGGTRS